MLEHKFSRLVRRIRAQAGACALVRHSAEKFDLIPANSPRLAALLRAPAWSVRVIGIFAHDVSADDLRRELRA